MQKSARSLAGPPLPPEKTTEVTPSFRLRSSARRIFGERPEVVIARKISCGVALASS
jgi:hypothetical protein